MQQYINVDFIGNGQSSIFVQFLLSGGVGNFSSLHKSQKFSGSQIIAVFNQNSPHIFLADFMNALMMLLMILIMKWRKEVIINQMTLMTYFDKSTGCVPLFYGHPVISKQLYLAHWPFVLTRSRHDWYSNCILMLVSHLIDVRNQRLISLKTSKICLEGIARLGQFS